MLQRIRVFLLTFLTLFPLLLYSAGGLQIQAPRPIIEMTTKGVVTLPFVVINNSTVTQLFEETLDLPVGWRLLTSPLPFSLNAGQRETRLIHLYPPTGVKPGKVQITYHVKSKTNRSLEEATQVQIQIKGESGAGLTMTSIPKNVIAGKTFQLEFQLENTGNQSEQFSILTNDMGHGLVTTVIPKRVTLKQGKTVTVKIKGKVPTNLPHSIHYLLKIKVKGKRSKTIFQEDVRFLIVSKTPVGVGKYHTLSSKLAVRYLSDNITDTNKEKTTSNSTQFEFSGRGTLDDQAYHHIEFDLRGKRKRQSDSTDYFGLDETYQLNYWNKQLRVDAGDFSAKGSGLLGSTHGRGLGLEYRKDNWWLNASKLADINDPSSKNSSLLRLGYFFENDVGLTVAIKQKKEEKKQYTFSSVEGEYSTESLRIKAELATQKNKTALLFDLAGQLKQFSYDARLKQADNDFKGALSDTRQINLNGNYPVTKRLSLGAGINYGRDNLENIATRKITERNEKYVRLGYDLWSNRSGQFSLETRQVNAKDLRDVSTLNIKEDSTKLRYQHRFDALNATVAFEQGQKKNRLTGLSVPVGRTALRLDFVPEDWDIQLGTFWETRKTDTRLEQKNYGLNLRWDYSKQTKFSAYWRKGSDSSTTPLDSTLYELNASHQFSNGLALALRGSKNNREQDKEDNGKEKTSDTRWMVELSMPLDIPFRKRENVGSLRGKVIHSTSGRAITDAIIESKGVYAVSDVTGNFHFPSLYTGDYELGIDLSHLEDGNYSTASGEPLKLNIVANQEQKIVIPLIRAASLQGTIAYQGQGTVKKGKNGLLVILSSKNKKMKIYKRLTLNNGYFSFVGIPPGKWKIQVTDPDNKLDREEIQNPVRTVQLRADKDIDIDFKISTSTSNVEKTGPSQGFSVSGD